MRHPRLQFDDFSARYQQAAANDRPSLLRAFVTAQQARGGFPVVEANGSAVFVYVGDGSERSVGVVGDFHTRSFNSILWYEAGEPLARLAPDAPVFWKRIQFENDARLDYQFVVDGKYLPDPRCPRTIVSGAAPSHTGNGEAASVLMMPGYPLSNASLPRADVAKGRLVVIDEAWANPKVTVYLPAEYDAGRDYPVLYTADGHQWRDFIGLPAILDNVIADRTIEPIIAVMIDSAVDRLDWYQFNPAYLAYLQKVVDWIDTHYSTRRRAAARVHAGSSAGARAGLQVGLARPDLIANLALFSPALMAPPNIYEPYFSGRKRPDRRLDVWLSAGSHEGYIQADARLMETYLRKVGVAVTAAYTHEGHSFGATRNLVPQMLAHFFPLRPRAPRGSQGTR